MRIKAIIISLALTTTLFAQVSRKIPSEKPRLIIGLHISEFRNDFITQYWDNLSEGGIKKLVTRGSYCKNATLNYTNKDHGVGIASIVTGTTPSEHGIVGESWYSSLKDEIIYCISDNTAKTVGGSFENGKYSPQNLLTTTYTDEIKLAYQFRPKVYSISLSPVSAILSAGHTADIAFWFDFELGDFITSSYYTDSLPNWVDTFNIKNIPNTYLEEGQWTMLLNEQDYSLESIDDSPYEIGIRKQTTFPYEMDKLSKKINKKEPFRALNYTPYGNTITKDFAIQTIVNEELGKDDIPDVLMLNFTAFENIASLYGPLSIEMEDMVLRLDKELEHFFEFIDNYVGLENTLIYFTSEQGIGYPSEYLVQNRIPAGEFTTNSANMLLQSYLNNLYGKGDWVKQFSDGQIHLNDNLILDAGLEPSEIQSVVADFIIQFHGIKHATTATMLQNTNFTIGIDSKIQNGYNKKRSGEVFYVLRDGFVEVTSDKVVLKSYHSNIPVIFYGWKIKRESIFEHVSLDDIAPTINSLLEIDIPSAATGEPIVEIIK